MRNDITFVGLDAHKKSIQVAMLLPGRKSAVEWQLANEATAVRRLGRKLKQEASGEVACCYEAGPCGYALQRQLEAAGVSCQVVAPSLIPVKAGARIKTDRRDARKLAELLRAGMLTEVHAPSEGEEAVRDLCRCREAAWKDQTRLRHRVNKFLLRRGRSYSAARSTWSRVHHQWLRSLRFDRAADQMVLDDYLLGLEQIDGRLHTLETRLAEIAQQEPYREPVAWLRCFRGIDTTTALSLVAELHDFRRFLSPRALMAYVGLVPSEHSSGDGRHRGAITKTGNSRVRRLLVETAWQYRHKPAVGLALKRRRMGQPASVIAIADRAQHRLYGRFERMTARGKPGNKVAVAVARELVGYLWTTLTPGARNAI